MATYGPLVKADTTPPTNIDLRDLERYTFSDGTSVAEAVGYVIDQAQAFNENRLGNRVVASVMDLLCTSPQSEQKIDFINGSFEWENGTEFGVPRPQRTTTAGGVVIPENATAGMGITWQALRKTPADRWIANVSRWVDGAVSMKRKSLLKTLATVTTARSHPGGNGSVSPGWIGGGSQNYIPPDKDGVSFTSDDHVDDNQADSDAGRLAAFTAMRDNLWEHGYFSEPGAPIILLHGTATLADVKAVSGYAARQQPFIQYGPGTTTSYAGLTLEDVAAFHGVWEPGGVWCIQIGGLPDNYFVMAKSFGIRNPMNPVREWASEDLGQQMVLQGIQPNPALNTSPLHHFTGYLEYGYGIQDPAAGAVSQIGGGGTYTDPTIT